MEDFKKFSLLKDVQTITSDGTPSMDKQDKTAEEDAINKALLPDEAILVMKKNRDFYPNNERIYDFGFYDGYLHAQHRTAELEAKIKALEDDRDYHAGNSLKNLIAVRSFQARIKALEERLDAADAFVKSYENSGYYDSVEQYETDLNNKVKKYQSLKK